MQSNLNAMLCVQGIQSCHHGWHYEHFPALQLIHIPCWQRYLKWNKSLWKGEMRETFSQQVSKSAGSQLGYLHNFIIVAIRFIFFTLQVSRKYILPLSIVWVSNSLSFTWALGSQMVGCLCCCWMTSSETFPCFKSFKAEPTIIFALLNSFTVLTSQTFKAVTAIVFIGIYVFTLPESASNKVELTQSLIWGTEPVIACSPKLLQNLGKNKLQSHIQLGRLCKCIKPLTKHSLGRVIRYDQMHRFYTGIK